MEDPWSTPQAHGWSIRKASNLLGLANWNEVKSVLVKPKLKPYVDATLSQQWGPQSFHCSNLCASCRRAQIFVVLSNTELLLVQIHSQIEQLLTQFCNPLLSFRSCYTLAKSLSFDAATQLKQATRGMLGPFLSQHTPWCQQPPSMVWGTRA